MAKIKNPNQELPLKKDKLGLNTQQQPQPKEESEPLEEARQQIIDTLEAKTLARQTDLTLEETFVNNNEDLLSKDNWYKQDHVPTLDREYDAKTGKSAAIEKVTTLTHTEEFDTGLIKPEPKPEIFEGINESTTGFSEPEPKPYLDTNVLIARLQMLNTLEGSDYEQLMLDVTDYMQTKDSLFMHTTDSVLTGYLIHLLEQISPNFNLTYQEEHNKTYATGVTKTNGLTVTAEHQFTVIALLLLYIKLTFM